MRKIVFQNGKELEVTDVTFTGASLLIALEATSVDEVIAQFRDIDATSVMRYYVGADLLRGYAGYTKLIGVDFTPDVVSDIDYNVEDATTESGFAEATVNVCQVRMEKSAAQTTGGSYPALVADVATLKDDVKKINDAMEGK